MLLRKTMSSLALSKLRKKTPAEKVEKPKKKIDRFDGLSEEDVQKYTLPDYMEMGLDMIFVGINPGLMAAYRGRYYAGPGNHFYKLLHQSGLTPRFVSYEEDHKLPQYGIGLTNIVARATRSSADLTRAEMKEGAKIVEEKLLLYKPKLVVFNGKCIYDAYSNKAGKYNLGLQPERIGNAAVWVTPSSSARCANFPRMVDKLHFFTALKKYLQFLKGEIKNVDRREFVFEGKCQQSIPTTSKMWRRKTVSAFLYGGRIANKDTMCLDTSEENVAVVHSTEFIVKKINPDANDGEHEIQGINKNQAEENSKDSTVAQKEDSEFLQNMSQTKDNGELEKGNHKYDVFCNAVVAKVQTNNHIKRKIKRLSPKPVRMKYNSESSASLDFVNLIKQRLREKMGDCNNDKEENVENK